MGIVNALMGGLMPGEHNYQKGQPMPGQGYRPGQIQSEPLGPVGSPRPEMMQPVPSEPARRGGFLGGVGNALGAVLKFSNPEAYEQGRQQKLTRNLGNALADGNYDAAAKEQLRAGNIDMGLKVQEMGQAQQAEQRKQHAQGVLQLFTSMQPQQVTQYAMEDPVGFERMTGMSSEEYMQAGQRMMQMGIAPDQFAQMAIQKAQAELGKQQGFTLGQGQSRYDAQGNLIAAVDPKETDPTEQWSPIAPPNGMGGYWERSDMTGQTRRVAAPPSNGVTIGADGSVQVGGPAGGNMPSKKTLTPLQLKMDEKYADTLAEWNTGGGPDVIKNLTQITDVANVLESGEGNYTGALLGLTPDWVLAGINPEAINQRELVEEVVQRNLRVTLGAQFTAKEGDNLIKRAYNRNLPEAMNAARLRRLAQLIEGRAQQLQSLNQFMLQNGTSAGWDGSLMTADQMLSDLDAVSGGANSPAKGQVRRRWNPETQTFEVVQ